jgi:hypothetical protein
LSSIGIGIANPSEALSFAGGLRQSGAVNPSIVSTYNQLLSDPRDSSAVGNYLYVVSSADDNFLAYDISDPIHPVQVGSIIDHTNLKAAYGVYATGSYAYVVSYTAKSLSVIDISNPANPTVAGRLTDATNLDSVSEVIVKGNTAYVISNNGVSNGFLAAFDISIPANPTFISRVVPGYPNWAPYSMSISDHYAYIDNYNPGELMIIDIASSTNMTVKSVLADPYSAHTGAVVVRGQYAYFGSYSNGTFVILDVSSSTNPIVKGSVTDASKMHGPLNIVISGNYAYVSSYYGRGLTAIDISSSTNPVITGNVDSTATLGTPSWPDAITQVGNYIYLGGTQGNVVIYDVSNPATPVEVGMIRGEDRLYYPNQIAANNNYAYIVNNKGYSLSIFDISDPQQTKFVKSLSSYTTIETDNFFDFISAVAVNGKYAYVTVRNGLRIVDISNPTNPILIGRLDDSNFISAAFKPIAIQGRYAYIVNTTSGPTTGHLLVVDIANPKKPSLVANYNAGTGFTVFSYLAVSGKYAYVTSLPAGAIFIIDISNPAAPALTGKYVDTTNMLGAGYFAVRGRYAYIVSGSRNSLVVVDISNPAVPTLAGKLIDATNLAGASKMALAGNYAYTTITGGIAVVNISNPALPKFVGKITGGDYLNSLQNIAVNGDYAYVVSNFANSFSVINLHNDLLGNISAGNYTLGNLNLTNGGIFSGNWTVRSSVNFSNSLKINRGASFGTSTMALNSSGFVGIGTTTANNILTVNKQAGKSALQIGGKYPACLKFKEVGGWTYCSALDGVLSCNDLVSCEQ